MYRAELKAIAKEQIRGKIGILFLCNLIIGVIAFVLGVIAFVLGLIPVAGPVLTFLVITPISFSIVGIYLGISHDVKPEIGDLLKGFNYFSQALILNLLVALFTFLWSLLLFVPGIIKSISYSMSMYILWENPDMKPLDALDESKRMMNDHKMDAFVLGLSFIGWALLGSITFGIAYIWVMPYMQATYTNFYHSLKGGYINSSGAEAYESQD
ncbi:membrane protein [Clostridia bacterium]|nr:membrane protein [Clostridia bacterium]